MAALGATQQRPRGVDAIAAHARFGLTGLASRALALPRTRAPASATPDACLRVKASVSSPVAGLLLPPKFEREDRRQASLAWVLLCRRAPGLLWRHEGKENRMT